MRITANTIELPDEILSEMWNSFDWDSAEQKVLKWQKLLSIASFKNHKEEMKKIKYSYSFFYRGKSTSSSQGI